MASDPTSERKIVRSFAGSIKIDEINPHAGTLPSGSSERVAHITWIGNKPHFHGVLHYVADQTGIDQTFRTCENTALWRFFLLSFTRTLIL